MMGSWEELVVREEGSRKAGIIKRANNDIHDTMIRMIQILSFTSIILIIFAWSMSCADGV